MNDVHWSISLLVSALPLLLLLASIVWAARIVASQLRSKDGRSLATLVASHLEEIEHKNERLDRILAEHEKRLDAVERK
jgi:hypothetical protein